MTLSQAQYDRPPEGLQRGLYPAPKWVVAAVGTAVVLGALLYLLWRAWRATRAPQGDLVRPSKRRP